MAQALNDLTELPFLLFLLMAVGLVVLWRTRPAIPRRRLLWVTVPFVLLWLLCIPGLAYFALGSLEWHYPPLARRPADTQAIVVLAGYVKPPDALRPEAELGDNTLYRCLRAAELYRQGPRCLVVVSGGSVRGSEPGPTCAEAMRALLVQLGVFPDDILEEGTSLTTYENARETAALLRQRGLTHVVVVTDAMHLWRSELCFRKQGVAAVPCGCNYRASHFDGTLADFLPDPAALEGQRLAAHEWLGLVWYWLRGRI